MRTGATQRREQTGTAERGRVQCYAPSLLLSRNSTRQLRTIEANQRFAAQPLSQEEEGRERPQTAGEDRNEQKLPAPCFAATLRRGKKATNEKPSQLGDPRHFPQLRGHAINPRSQRGGVGEHDPLLRDTVNTASIASPRGNPGKFSSPNANGSQATLSPSSPFLRPPAIADWRKKRAGLDPSDGKRQLKGRGERGPPPSSTHTWN